MAEPLDCSSGWQARYANSAYANAVCTHVGLTGESVASTEYNGQNAAAAGMGVRAYLDEVSRQTGRPVDSLRTFDNQQPVTGSVPLGLLAVGGVAVAAGIWWFSGRKRHGR